MKKKILFILIISILPGSIAVTAQNLSEMETIINKSKNLIGLQYVVFNRSKIVYSKAVGLSEIKNRIKLERNTRMMAYSMTKTYTAILGLCLAQENLIDLDAPVKSYLPRIPYSNELKVSHLITQTSGIPNPIPLKWVHATGVDFDSTTMLYKLLAENSELEFPPGSKYAYSNLSYWLLEEIVQKVTGRPFEDVIFQKLFAKAGLSKASINFNYKGTTVSKGYLSKNFFMKLVAPFLIDKSFLGEEEEGWLAIKPHILYSKGMGGIIASGESLARVMIEVIRPNSNIFENNTKQLLFEVQKNIYGKPIEMTYGFHVKFDKDSNVDYYYKEGGGASFHTELRYYPNSELGTIVMANSNNFDVKNFLNTIDTYFIKNHTNEVKK